MASEFNPEQPQSAQYVSREMTGHERLDAYGRWETHRQYGPIWFPTAVPADRAPYRFGHWKSIAPFGDGPGSTTSPGGSRRCITAAGFASASGRAWAAGRPRQTAGLTHRRWLPFSKTASPTAPRVAEPPVGWFPLAPGEAYIPWYAAGPAYVERVNLIFRFPIRFGRPGPNAREPAAQAGRAEFANRRFATVVQRDAFAYGRPVMREIVRVPEDRLDACGDREGSTADRSGDGAPDDREFRNAKRDAWLITRDCGSGRPAGDLAGRIAAGAFRPEAIAGRAAGRGCANRVATEGFAGSFQQPRLPPQCRSACLRQATGAPCGTACSAARRSSLSATTASNCASASISAT